MAARPPPPPHSGFKMTACVLPKCPFRNKRKRSSRIDFTHRTFAEKGGGVRKKARIQKKKVEPYWLYTPDFCWKGGVGWNTHMRTLNNNEWGAGNGSWFILKSPSSFRVVSFLSGNRLRFPLVERNAQATLSRDIICAAQCPSGPTRWARNMYSFVWLVGFSCMYFPP